jgi:glutamine synthetase type III
MCRARFSQVILILGVMVAVVGCAGALIPGHKVADTPANREIYEVVESYRDAMEKRDSDKIKSLASRHYFENASTTNQEKDDYGFDSLMDQVLPKLTDNIKSIRYRIQIRAITIHGNSATADYEYFWKFQYTEGGRENWSSSNDFNRLSMVREDGAWKIVAGM